MQSVKQINADREGKIKSAPTLMHIKSANVPEWSVSTFKPSFWPTNINDKVRVHGFTQHERFHEDNARAGLLGLKSERVRQKL